MLKAFLPTAALASLFGGPPDFTGLAGITGLADRTFIEFISKFQINQKN
jgi:hypothetical protein